jgi:hypothetical protein
MQYLITLHKGLRNIKSSFRYYWQLKRFLINFTSWRNEEDAVVQNISRQHEGLGLQPCPFSFWLCMQCSVGPIKPYPFLYFTGLVFENVVILTIGEPAFCLRMKRR